MFGLEKSLADQLKRLRDEFGLHGVKSEFETEGSTFRDLARLRRITARLDIFQIVMELQSLKTVIHMRVGH